MLRGWLAALWENFVPSKARLFIVDGKKGSALDMCESSGGGKRSMGVTGI